MNALKSSPILSTGALRLSRVFVENPNGGRLLASDAVTDPSETIFEYLGATSLMLVSPITRKVYRFEQSGARVVVDARDRTWIALVRDLVAVGQ